MRGSPLLLVMILGVGCEQATASDPRQPPGAASSAFVVPPSAHEALDKLDQRRPVPLLPMMAQHQKESMRDHLQAVQEVLAAAAASDFEQVALAAKRMGLSEPMRRMCEHMGAAAPGFTERALGFHRAADEIVGAAKTRDSAAVLDALARTLRECTTCHATYKQQIVARLPD